MMEIYKQEPEPPFLLGLFDEALPLRKNFCEQVDNDKYKEQRDYSTYKSLQLLIQHLEWNPDIHRKVLRKRKLEELKHRGIVSYLKCKIGETLKGEKFLQSLVSNEECELQLERLKIEIQKAHNYSHDIRQESDGPVACKKPRLASETRAHKQVRFEIRNKSSMLNKFDLMDTAKLVQSPLTEVGRGGGKGRGGHRDKLVRRPLREVTYSSKSSTPLTQASGRSSLAGTPVCINFDASMQTSILNIINDKLAHMADDTNNDDDDDQCDLSNDANVEVEDDDDGGGTDKENNDMDKGNDAMDKENDDVDNGNDGMDNDNDRIDKEDDKATDNDMANGDDDKDDTVDFDDNKENDNKVNDNSHGDDVSVKVLDEVSGTMPTTTV